MIVVAGEALIDLIVGPAGSLVAVPGGGPYNTARTIARLGERVAFLGRISTDGFGRQLRATLERDGVDPDGIVATDAPTTLALAELDADGGATYRFYVEGTSAPGLIETDVPSSLTRAAAALHVGTLGLALEPIGTTLERLVHDAEPTLLVMVDPNCRPTATPDVRAFRARIERIAERADVVKVSDDDLRCLAPGGDLDAAVDRLLALGARVVLRTHAADDVEIRTQSDRVLVPVPAVDVVDTVGAGDAFGGGFLASWIGSGHGREELASIDVIVDAVRMAVRVAALTCTRAGADPPTRAELLSFAG